MTTDPLHARAVNTWARLERSGSRLATSVPVVMETFTFLERNTTRTVALRWKDSLANLRRLRVLECRRADLTASWRWFERRELHKLSSVDAVSFVLMTKASLREVFTFDHHFASAGFRIID
ncbi:MAG: PIN domain-containing protein [Myxococcaceae bacterium]|nr:PIN domain-containing protein [Myxococcaceae bacterium]